MKRILSLAILGSLVLGAACGKGRSASADTTLNSDLSLAAQQSGRGAAFADTAQIRASQAPTASHHVAARGGEVSRPARRSASSGSSSGGQTAASAPSGGTVEKHTNRDAAIGAAAGAILGATTSKNKVKGGLIGAAVGGVLGGVIGNNVDKKKKP